MTAVGAVILAAGFGTRLAPLTDETPKPLLDIAGQPVATRLVHQLAQVPGLAHITVVVNECHAGQWRSWQRSLPPSPPVRLVSNGVRDESQRPGAVADLLLGLRTQRDESADQWLVLAGDNLLDEDLGAHVRASAERNAPVVLCRDLGDDVPPGRFGEVTVDDRGVVVGFREKPPEPRSPLAATCSYVLPADAQRWVSEYLDGGGDPDSPGRLMGWLSGRRRVVARTLTGRYFDIGNRETLDAARAAYGDPHRL